METSLMKLSVVEFRVGDSNLKTIVPITSLYKGRLQVTEEPINNYPPDKVAR